MASSHLRLTTDGFTETTEWLPAISLVDFASSCFQQKKAKGIAEMAAGHFMLTANECTHPAIRFKCLWAISPVGFTSLDWKVGKEKDGLRGCQQLVTAGRKEEPNSLVQFGAFWLSSGFGSGATPNLELNRIFLVCALPCFPFFPWRNCALGGALAICSSCYLPGGQGMKRMDKRECPRKPVAAWYMQIHQKVPSLLPSLGTAPWRGINQV